MHHSFGQQAGNNRDDLRVNRTHTKPNAIPTSVTAVSCGADTGSWTSLVPCGLTILIQACTSANYTAVPQGRLLSLHRNKILDTGLQCQAIICELGGERREREYLEDRHLRALLSSYICRIALPCKMVCQCTPCCPSSNTCTPRKPNFKFWVDSRAQAVWMKPAANVLYLPFLLRT